MGFDVFACEKLFPSVESSFTAIISLLDDALFQY